MKIVLDPGLLWFDKSKEHEEFMYLKDVIDFIDTYLSIRYLPIYEFIMRLYTIAKDPLGEYRESEIVKQDIISKIWKNLDFSNPDDMIYLTDCEKNIIPEDFKIIDREDIKKYFNNLWELMTEKKHEIVFFLCVKNHGLKERKMESIHFVRHIYREVDSYLGELFSNGSLIRDEAVKIPSLNFPLPNIQLCSEYSVIRKKIIKDGNADNDNFLKLGREVAYRNGYIFNKELTKINNTAIREIFSSKTNPVIYLSIDFEKGAFEVCNHSGAHMGEFSYEGKQIGKAKSDHSIKIKK